jgi:hypothetical protein
MTTTTTTTTTTNDDNDNDHEPPWAKDGMSEKKARVHSSQPDSPSAKPNDSTTGNIARMVKNAVPSFISSLTILPLLLATTAYTLPSTSATTQRRQHADARVGKSMR